MVLRILTARLLITITELIFITTIMEQIVIIVKSTSTGHQVAIKMELIKVKQLLMIAHRVHRSTSIMMQNWVHDQSKIY